MSYNISTIQYAEGVLYITKEKVLAWLSEQSDRPESNFINDLLVPCRQSGPVKECFLLNGRAYELKSKEDPIPIERPNWCHDFSGHTFEGFKGLLSFTTGKAKLILIWEHGDSTSGLIVENGVVTDGEVKQTVVPKKVK